MKRACGLLFCLAVSCGSSGGPDPVEEIRFLMDTVIRITAYDAQRSAEEVRSVLDGAFDLMARMEKMTSRYADSSEVAGVNREAGGSAPAVSEEVFEIFQCAEDVSRETGGAFDVSVDAVERIWGFATDHPRVPDARSIERMLRFVDSRKIRLDRPRVGLAEAGMSVDLGGLAKGYVVDRAVEYLRDAGIPAGIVDAGGDLRIFGDHPRRRVWRIGVRHPRSEGGMLGTIETKAASIATSGDYERYFMEGGIRYHHILDPRTGRPARGCVSVTILTERAMTADAYATAVFVMGPERGMDFIETNPGVEGILVSEEDGVLSQRVSSGLQEHFRAIEERGS